MRTAKDTLAVLLHWLATDDHALPDNAIQHSYIPRAKPSVRCSTAVLTKPAAGHVCAIQDKLAVHCTTHSGSVYSLQASICFT